MSMRNRALMCWTPGGLLLAAASGAQAANLGFLNDTPISYMKQRDIHSVKRAVFRALDESNDGETTNWLNEGTGNSVKIDATITPDRTTKEGDRTCRSTVVVLNAKGQSMNLHPLFCKQAGGAWQMQKK
jgi:surface antigen